MVPVTEELLNDSNVAVTSSSSSSSPGLPFGLTQGQISQIWPFLIALGLGIFGLAFWLFFGLLLASLALKTLVWP